MRTKASLGYRPGARHRACGLIAVLCVALGSSSAAAQIQFSPDEKFAVCSTAHGVVLSDLVTGEKREFGAKLEGGKRRSVSLLAFSPNGDRVLACADERLYLLEFPGGDVVKVFYPSGTTTALAFLPNGAGFLRGTEEGALELYDLTTFELANILLRKGTGRVGSIDCSPDGKHALTTGQTDHVRLWNLHRQNDKPGVLVAYRPDGVTPWAEDARFTPDGKSAVVAGGGEYLRVFDIETGKVRRTIAPADAPKQKWRCNVVVVTPDGRRAITGDNGGLRLIDLKTDKPVRTIVTVQGTAVDWVAVSPSGTRGLSQTRDGGVALWDLTDKDLPRVLRGPGLHPVRGDELRCYTAVAFVGPDRVLLGDTKGRLALHDTATGRLVSELHKASNSGVLDLAVTPDGKFAVVAANFGQRGAPPALGIWDLKAGRLVRQWQEKENGYVTVAISADGNLAAGGTEGGHLRVVELPGGKEVEFAHPRAGRIHGLAFASGAKGGVELVVADHSREGGAVYDAETLAHRRDFPIRFGKPLLVAEAGRPLLIAKDGVTAVVGGRELRAYDIRDGRHLRTLSYGTARWRGQDEKDQPGVHDHGHPNDYRVVALSPDRAFVLACGPGNRLRLWKAENSVAVREFATAWVSETITCAAFSPDGRQAVTAGRGSSLHLWDVETGKLIRELDVHRP